MSKITPQAVFDAAYKKFLWSQVMTFVRQNNAQTPPPQPQTVWPFIEGRFERKL